MMSSAGQKEEVNEQKQRPCCDISVSSCSFHIHFSLSIVLKYI